jgi:16S rRNA C967 or C1407 C5-methylase (RsmB/RsmF family)
MQEKTEALPAEFCERIRRDFPSGTADAIFSGMTGPRRVSFRLNHLHPDAAAAITDLISIGLAPKPIEGLPDAFSLPEDDRSTLLESTPVADGRLYVQNASSQLPPHILAPQPGEKVLDLAAAPGSKTLQIAAMMQNEGELAAVELVRSRFYRMNALLKRYGAENVRTFLKNGMDVWRHRPEYFDRVLLDAPCASEGRFHAGDPDSLAYWSPRKVKEMVRKQRRLLFSAVNALRSGGVLVYSTCSLSLDENEGVLSDILEQFEGALEVDACSIAAKESREPEAASANRRFDPSLKNARRIIPGDIFEGFFVCRLTKNRSTLDRSSHK